MENNLDMTHLISTKDEEEIAQQIFDAVSASTTESLREEKPIGFKAPEHMETNGEGYEKSDDPDALWKYHNMVQAVEPDHKHRTGTNQTPAKKAERKKRKARKVQRSSRKTNRKH